MTLKKKNKKVPSSDIDTKDSNLYTKRYKPKTRYPRPRSMTSCIIEGHYYKEDLDPNNRPLKDKHSFYVRCECCGNKIIIHNKAEKEGNVL